MKLHLTVASDDGRFLLHWRWRTADRVLPWLLAILTVLGVLGWRLIR